MLIYYKTLLAQPHKYSLTENQKLLLSLVKAKTDQTHNVTRKLFVPKVSDYDKAQENT